MELRTLTYFCGRRLLTSHERFSSTFLKRMSFILWSLCAGAALSVLSWALTYFDSIESGMASSSPVSPSRIKTQSGHSFHMGYVICILNGILMYTTSTYWLNTSFSQV